MEGGLVMATAPEATIHLKTSFAHRNTFSGKLRMRGTTMQAFLTDIVELVNTDEAFLEMLEEKRMALVDARDQPPALVDDSQTETHDSASPAAEVPAPGSRVLVVRVGG
jgi:hypothetical protein